MSARVAIPAAVALFFLIVLLQNSDYVDFHLLAWTWLVRKLVLLPIVLVIGVVLGWILGKLTGRSSGAATPRVPPAGTPPPAMPPTTPLP